MIALQVRCPKLCASREDGQRYNGYAIIRMNREIVPLAAVDWIEK